ncbi:MAG TPA: putative lipid II flippase FtsW [Gammaproteobacteria bacterium]|nr:putative lipid II flippase FtsW [Gammaproteobacteria bacterium]
MSKAIDLSMPAANEGRQRRRRIEAYKLAHVDWALLAVIVALSLLGATMVFSASMPFAEKQYGDPFFFINRQMVFMLAGVAIGYGLFQVPVDRWESVGPMLLIAGLVLLALVLVPGIGKEVNGSRRWLNIGFIGIQVSEAVKLFIVVYLAGYLVRRGERVQRELGAFIRPLILICLAGFLLMLEPDFGATVVIVMTAMAMLFVGGVQFRQFLLLICGFAVTLALLVWISPYRMKRLTSFLDPWADPFNNGFQLSQSLIAIGSGSWQGVGLGNSVQKLLYLPESHTDFLFAVYAEEMGLIGVIILIALFAFLVLRCLKIASQAEEVGNRFAAFVAFGIAIWVGMQAFINIGVNMGVLPTKGITLPLMSYGGSSVLMMAVTFALIMRIDHETRLLKTARLSQRKLQAGEGA